MEHIQEFGLMAAGLQSLLDGQRAVVVALAGAAAQQQSFHIILSPISSDIIRTMYHVSAIFASKYRFLDG